MAFPTPKLDERTFDDLMREAREIVRNRSPEWTDTSPSDPGMVLVELFAFLTDNMLYRLNRVPEKVHVALLNLIGVTMLAPAAAQVRLTFVRTAPVADKPIAIPAGTRVSDAAGAVTFTTLADTEIAAGAPSNEVNAIHADLVEGELVGMGNGEPAQSVRLRRAPLVRHTPELATLTVGIEEEPEGLDPGLAVRQFGGKPFVVWKEVSSFQGLADGDRAYTLDRVTGTISFSPLGGSGSATFSRIPPKGAEIRAWYRIGGGKVGNVLPNTLAVMRDPVPGVSVSNAGRASGGEDGETLERAMLRAREAVQALSSAVTARDFERIALLAGGVSRARAFAQREHWVFGEPGVVEIRVVPTLLPGEPPTLETLRGHQTELLRERIDALIADYRPIGVRTKVLWAHCRPVSIASRVVVSPVEDPEAVRNRLLRRLDDLISPNGQWPFGKTLRASDVYEAILAEPGVRFAEQLSFTIDEGPQAEVVDLHRDPNQPRTFYAAAAGRLYRTMDSAESWTTIIDQPDSEVTTVRTDPEQPGVVMALLSVKDAETATVQLSNDGGETWNVVETVQGEKLYDIASLKNGPRAQLFYASRKGLRVISLGDASSSILIDQLEAGARDAALNAVGIYAVAVARFASGVPCIAVARREKRGVLISRDGGRAGSFQPIPGAEGRDVRRLIFQREGDRLFLWAAVAAERGENGEGVIRVEARGDGIDPEGWKVVGTGWNGGSCTGIAFAPGLVAASSNRTGVALLDTGKANATWTTSQLGCGLPIEEDRKTLVPLSGLALGLSAPLVLAGAAGGVFASRDRGLRYVAAGQVEFTERAPLPPNSLYCSGTHDITVVRENEMEG